MTRSNASDVNDYSRDERMAQMNDALTGSDGDHFALDFADDIVTGVKWLAAICAFAILAFVAAPGVRILIDAATTRPAICAGLGAGECGEAVGMR